MNMSWGRDGRDRVGVMTVLPPHKSQKNSAAHSHGALQFTSFLTHRGSADWCTDHAPLRAGSVFYYLYENPSGIYFLNDVHVD